MFDIRNCLFILLARFGTSLPHKKTIIVRTQVTGGLISNRIRSFSGKLQSNSDDHESQVIQEITKLDAEIRHHNYMYYSVAQPEVSDAEYDQLTKRAKDLIETYPHLKEFAPNILSVGYIPSDKVPQKKHRTPMLSLDNAMNQEELAKFINKVIRIHHSSNSSDGVKINEEFPNNSSLNNHLFIIEPKIDGLSLSLLYEYGKLKHAVTRGDGRIGEDVTLNALNILDLPHSIPINIPIVEVRGEVYMSIKDFNDENLRREKVGQTPQSNPRNAAAGAIRRLDSSQLYKQCLRFFAYWLDIAAPAQTTVTATESTSSLELTIPNTQKDTLNLLSNWKFSTAKSFDASSFEDVWTCCEKFSEERSKLSFEADGVVVKVNNEALQKRIGDARRAPRWAIAYKFAAAEVTTELLNITVQVGRTGALTPVAVLKPVHLAGVTVERATLHNQKEVQRLRLVPGCRVLVKRSGDVIPKVVARVDISSDTVEASAIGGTFFNDSSNMGMGKELEDGITGGFIFQLPTQCPSCGAPAVSDKTEVGEDGGVVRCQSDGFTCPAQAVERLRYFCSRDAADITSMGPVTVQTLYNEGLLRFPADIFSLPRKDAEMESAWASRNVTKKNSSEEVSENKGLRPLSALPGWGRKSAQKLLQSIESRRSIPLDRFLVALGIRHVGQGTATDIASYFGSLEALLSDVRSGAEGLRSIDGVGPKAIASLTLLLGESMSPVVSSLLLEVTVAPVPIVQKKIESTPVSPVASPTTTMTSTTTSMGNKLANDGSKSLPLHGQVVVLSGKLYVDESKALSRKEASTVCTQLGGTVSSSVSRSTTLFVAGDDAGPSKLAKASRLGITVWDRSRWMDLLQENKELWKV